MKFEKSSSSATLNTALKSSDSKPLHPFAACRYRNGSVHRKLRAQSETARQMRTENTSQRDTTRLKTNCTIWPLVTKSLKTRPGRWPSEESK